MRPAPKLTRTQRADKKVETILEKLLQNPGMNIDIRHHINSMEKATLVLNQITSMLTMMGVEFQERHGTHVLCVLSDNQIQQKQRIKVQSIHHVGSFMEFRFPEDELS